MNVDQMGSRFILLLKRCIRLTCPHRREPAEASFIRGSSITSLSTWNALPLASQFSSSKLPRTMASVEAGVGNVHAPDPPGTDPFARLKAHLHEFVNEKFLKEPERYEPLKTGQWPRFIIVTCMDTRTAPEIYLGLQPGEAIVIRNVAALVPPYSAEKEHNLLPSVGSGLEYAIKVLKAQYIVVTGHAQCGGIVHLINSDGAKKQSFEFVEKWIKIAEDAHTKTIKEVGEDASFDVKHDVLARAAVNNSLKNLLTYPYVTEAIKERGLRIFGSYWDNVNAVYEHWDYVDGKVGPTHVL